MRKRSHSKDCAANQMHFANSRPPVEKLILRRFDPARDSYEELTSLLHHAFVRLGEMGLNCTCVDQTDSVTRQRAESGDCFVATSEGRIIATMTIYERDPRSACELYRCGRVATIRQLGVDPKWQGLGIGKALIDYAERWAVSHGYAELALDTPNPAAHLVEFYRGRGFRIVRVMRFASKLYDSAIFSKALVVARTLAAWSGGGYTMPTGDIRFVL
jgi:GNAT superfamily N-acetyltransferase